MARSKHSTEDNGGRNPPGGAGGQGKGRGKPRSGGRGRPRPQANGKPGPRPAASPARVAVEDLHNRNGVGEQLHQADALNAGKVKPQAIRWLWKPRIPFGGPTLLTGRSESGKTTLAAEIAACLTTGRPLPGGKPLPPMGVLWFSAEEDLASIVTPRLMAAGANLDLVHFPQRHSDGHSAARFGFPSAVSRVVDLVRLFNVGLVVIDPITSYLDEGLLADSGHAARAVLEACAEIGQATGCCSLPIKHVRKSRAGDAKDQVSGSAEWVNFPRSALLTSAHPDNPQRRILASAKRSIGQEVPSLMFDLLPVGDLARVEWAGETALKADDLNEDPGDSVERGILEQAKELLLQQLGSGPKKSKDLLRLGEDCGIKSRMMQLAKRRLGIAHQWVNSGGVTHSLWYPPEGGK